MLKLIDFWAEWCPPCKLMSPIVEEAAKELKGKIEVIKVNVDQERAEAEKYEIFSIPTFVLEKEGKEIGRTTGSRTKEEFKEWIKKHLW